MWFAGFVDLSRRRRGLIVVGLIYSCAVGRVDAAVRCQAGDDGVAMETRRQQHEKRLRSSTTWNNQREGCGAPDSWQLVVCLVAVGSSSEDCHVRLHSTSFNFLT